MPERKVIQIAPWVVPGMDNHSSPTVRIVALCDDGTLWIGEEYGGWTQMMPPTSYADRVAQLKAEKDRLWERISRARQAIRDREEVEVVTAHLDGLQPPAKVIPIGGESDA